MVAYCVREGRIWLPTVAGARRLRNLAIEPSASFLVTEGEADDHIAVLIEGQAIIRDDPTPILNEWLSAAWRDRYGKELTWAGAIIELLPTKVLSHSARG
jgi:hypothetical protein